MPSGPSSRSGRTKTTTDEPGHIERGSGNVFADLGIPNPDLALAKAELVRRIRDVIAERKLTQAKAAELLGLDQPKVSALVRGRVAGYTIDRLFRFLTALGQRIEITVRPNAKNTYSAAHFRVHTGRWPCRSRPALAFAGASACEGRAATSLKR